MNISEVLHWLIDAESGTGLDKAAAHVAVDAVEWADKKVDSITPTGTSTLVTFAQDEAGKVDTFAKGIEADIEAHEVGYTSAPTPTSYPVA